MGYGAILSLDFCSALMIAYLEVKSMSLELCCSFAGSAMRTFALLIKWFKNSRGPCLDLPSELRGLVGGRI